MTEPQLRALDEDLWVLDQPLNLFGLRIGARMTIVRLTNGSLWLHSPVEIDATARAELHALGPVRHVVAPSKVHHFWVEEARLAFPDARFYAAPGLREKKPKLPFDEELGDEPPAAWTGQIEQLVFRAAPYTNEVVFCHPKSRSLVFTDLVFNMREGENRATRFWLWVNQARGRFGPHRMMRFFVKDRAEARRAVDRILTWDFERVILSHGAILQEKGPRLVREGWRYLDD